MTAIIKYFSARNRLVEINKTIEAMGGDEESSSMLLAQRDMAEYEVTYFYYETISSVIYTFVFLLILIVGYGVYEVI